MVQTATAKIAAKAKPRPQFLTEGGPVENRWELKQRAELLEKFTDGVFYQARVYSQLTEVFRDACVYGTGCVKIFELDRRVTVERIPPYEIVVDDGEAYAGPDSVRTLYQRKYFDRLHLRSMYADDPEKAAAIDRAQRDPEDIEFAYQTTADPVLVTEAWRLPDNDQTPGRHCIVVDGCTLLDEEWEGPFPFAFFRWSKPLAGFFGVGLAEELRPLQAEINRLLMQIQRGHYLIAGHWLVDQSSKIAINTINNDLAAIVKYAGTPPQYQAPAIIAPEVYQHLWNLYSKAYEISGISQLNASGLKPSGLNSGAAQRAFQDITSERFTEVFENYDSFVVEIARQIIRCVRRIGGNYKVKALQRDGFQELRFRDVNIDEEAYVLKVYPSSFLPSTPAGKLAAIQDLINAKILPPDELLELLDLPDTEALSKRKNAARRIIEKNISHMLRTGEAVSPEPFDNHKLALEMVNAAYEEARLDGAPEDRLERLREYLRSTADYLAKANPPPPPAPPMAPAPAGPMSPEPPAPPMALAS